MELNLLSDLAPFFIALAMLVVLKLKMWRNVNSVMWPQRICALLLGPTIIYCFYLLNILIGTIDDNAAAYGGLFLLFFLATTTPVFSLVVVITKVTSYIRILVIAIAIQFLCLFGLFLFTDRPGGAADLVRLDVFSVLVVLATIFASAYWAYIKNWPPVDIQSKMGRNE